MLQGVRVAVCMAWVCCWGSARAEPASAPKLDAAKDASKIDELVPEKLELRPKIRECCGYPVGQREGFRLSFYWLAYESEYANEPYDTDIYTRQGFFLGRFPSAFVYELKLE